jgi:hypothetical protein
MEDSAADPVGLEALAMAGRLIGAEAAPHGTVEKRGGGDRD